MADRVAKAESLAAANGTSAALAKLRVAAGKSSAVRVRSLDEVLRLVSSDNQLMGNFYDLKGAGLLRPDATHMEAARQSAEPLVFLNYHEKIQCAALTLDDSALFSYGNCAMFFEAAKIAKRATAFEENCVVFCQRLNLGPRNTKLPPGYRATWPRRADLVVAKLADRLKPDSKESDFPSLLLSAGSDPASDDFVEVHIYDRLHRSAIEYVVVKLRRTGDKTLVRAIRAALGDSRVKTA